MGEGGREIEQEKASGVGWERDIARANKWGRVGEGYSKRKQVGEGGRGIEQEKAGGRLGER